jgi:D-3-phosphoglycerate dehydrogenase / 2-oxoglutarate reductase
MTEKRILLPQPIEKEAVAILDGANCDIVLSPDPKPETVRPLMKETNGIILRTGIKMTRELMSQAGVLRVISRTGAGVDNVDVLAATELGIAVACVPGANARTVAEHALSLILALMKQIFALDREVRQDNYGIRYKYLPQDMVGKTLGLVGLGRIGSEIARVCYQSFDMRVIAYDPYLPIEVQEKYRGWVEFCGMEKVFREADVISLHIPLSPETKNLVGPRELGWMKPDAYIVNTSRGGVLDEKALIQVLKEKKIGGAGLDVQANEPPEKDNPLKQLDNVILTPHTGGLTREMVVRLAVEAARSAVDILEGRKPAEGIVNPEVFNGPRWQGYFKG